MVKPGTLHFDSYSKTYRFVGTDHEGNEVNVIYRGKVAFETKEGETVVLVAYLPDAENRVSVVATEYVSNHGMEAEKWESKSIG